MGAVTSLLLLYSLGLLTLANATKLKELQALHSGKVRKLDAQQDTVILSFSKSGSDTVQNYSCDSLRVSGLTELSVPQQVIPPSLTCRCVAKDTVLMAVHNLDQSQSGLCVSDTCREPGPGMEKLDAEIEITAKYLKLSDGLGNTFRYKDPMAKSLSFLSLYFDQEIDCHLEHQTTEVPTTTPVQQACVTPAATTAPHSQSLIILALVSSVLINVLIIIVSVFLYHKLQTRNIKRKVPRMVTAAMQMAQVASENTPLSPRTPQSPGSGYTPLGRLNPVLLPTGIEISGGGETNEQTYGANYATSSQNLAADGYSSTIQGRHSNYLQLSRTPNNRSLSDVSSLAPSSDSGLANSRTAILSASLGNNLHKVHRPSPLAAGLDTQVPCAATATGGAAMATGGEGAQKALPALPSRVTEMTRGISRTSNSYDYIDYDNSGGSGQVDREPSHKYLQIT